MFDFAVFSENLRSARRNKGLSQQQLAQLLFVSAQAVSKWEKGETVPDVPHICALAEELEISVDALLGVNAPGEPAMIAIDAGGTKTECVLITPEGQLLRRLVLPGANPNTCGLEGACEIFCRGIDTLVQKDYRLIGIYIGGAGMASAGNDLAAEAILRNRYPKVPVRCQTDICNVLACAQDPDNAIAVICGTGSVVYTTCEGNIIRASGGAGWRLETVGSGYDMGRQAVHAAWEHRDESGPATMLTELVEQKLGGKVWEHIPDIYSSDPGFIAAFAPLTILAWQQGDAVAEGIVRQNAERLAHLIHTAAKKSPKAKQVLMGGSLLTQCDPFRQWVESLLSPALQSAVLDKPQIWGACLQCAKLTGNRLTAEEAFFAKYNMED